VHGGILGRAVEVEQRKTMFVTNDILKALPSADDILARIKSCRDELKELKRLHRMVLAAAKAKAQSDLRTKLGA
jgi:hypothetical protein